ncbi:ZN862 protein, partial [Polyodon spathula]|nr:ZN862 protein [Polyodon spathula]
MKDGKAPSWLIGNFDMPDGTAETITNTITCVLQQCKIPIAKVVGFGSDGAAVMRVSGVSTDLKLNPRMTSVHCTALRVALASSGAAAKVNKIKQYKQTVNTVFNYFKYSACRCERLQEFNRILDEEDFANTTVEGLHKQVSTYSFVATTYMLLDVMPIMDRLNKVFQLDNVNLGLIKPSVKIALDLLGDLLTSRGDQGRLSDRL